MALARIATDLFFVKMAEGVFVFRRLEAIHLTIQLQADRGLHVHGWGYCCVLFQLKLIPKH